VAEIGLRIVIYAMALVLYRFIRLKRTLKPHLLFPLRVKRGTIAIYNEIMNIMEDFEQASEFLPRRE